MIIRLNKVKKILMILILIGLTCYNNLYSQSLSLPESSYSLISTSNTSLKPIELNMNFVPDGDNSKLEIGVVCNQTLGDLTLYTNLTVHGIYPNIGQPNWFENFIKTSWFPDTALQSFPTTKGITINCKQGAIYHFEYKFKWVWEDMYNKIFAFAYVQDATTKEILDLIRSNNILYSEFNQLVPANYLILQPGKNSYNDFVITNPTKENITYEVNLQCNNISWKVASNKYIIPIPAGFSDTFTLNIKTTPRTQYGNVTLTVTPKYLKNSYSVPESRTITKEVITDGIELLAVTNEYIQNDYYQDKSTPWYYFIRGACFAQPDIGNKTVFINYNDWQTYFPDINYKILYIFGNSSNYKGWGSGNTLEKAALDCIDNGKPLIVSSNVGLSIYSDKLSSYKASPQAKDFYKRLGIEYRGFINLPNHDTASCRIVTKNALNLDIFDTNTIINSGDTLAKRLDYIGITGDNKATFPFLWFNRKNEPANSYAGVATIIGKSKIIYISPGLETIGGKGDTLLIRNFLNWLVEPTAVSEIKNFTSLTLYPNPANQYFDIEYANTTSMSDIGKQGVIQIYNSIGENVTELITLEGNRVNVKNLSSGLYFCRINTGNCNISKSFIISR
jgi:hypothetical protein